MTVIAHALAQLRLYGWYVFGPPAFVAVCGVYFALGTGERIADVLELLALSFLLVGTVTFGPFLLLLPLAMLLLVGSLKNRLAARWGRRVGAANAMRRWSLASEAGLWPRAAAAALPAELAEALLHDVIARRVQLAEAGRRRFVIELDTALIYAQVTVGQLVNVILRVCSIPSSFRS